jgi:hypothetical protein
MTRADRRTIVVGRILDGHFGSSVGDDRLLLARPSALANVINVNLLTEYLHRLMFDSVNRDYKGVSILASELAGRMILAAVVAEELEERERIRDDLEAKAKKEAT